MSTLAEYECYLPVPGDLCSAATGNCERLAAACGCERSPQRGQREHGNRRSCVTNSFAGLVDRALIFDRLTEYGWATDGRDWDRVAGTVYRRRRTRHGIELASHIDFRFDKVEKTELRPLSKSALDGFDGR